MGFADRSIHRCEDVQISLDLINFAGTASFFLGESAPPLSVKISWVIAREDGEWRIVSHHVSSKTPLI